MEMQRPWTFDLSCKHLSSGSMSRRWLWCFKHFLQLWTLFLSTSGVLRSVVGWGGVGVGTLTFRALAHMVHTTQLMGLGWGGVGMSSHYISCEK